MNSQNTKEGVFYVNLDRFLRVISYIVGAWGENHPSIEQMQANRLLKEFAEEEKSYAEDYNMPKFSMPVIHFEKLVTFIYQFWQEIFEKDRDKPVSNDERFIHNFAFGKIANAKHGPRVMLQPTTDLKEPRKEQRFFNHILYLLQEEGISKYLKVVPFKDDDEPKEFRNVLNYDISQIEDRRAYVQYSSNTGDIKTHFKGFSQKELYFVYSFFNQPFANYLDLKLES